MLSLKRCKEMNSLVIRWDVQGMGQTKANKGVSFKGASHVNMSLWFLLGAGPFGDFELYILCKT